MTITQSLTTFALVSSLTFAASGCATTSASQDAEAAAPARQARKPKEDKAVAKVRAQASFDLNCDANALTVSLLDNEPGMMGSNFATYGVRGCEHQATYKASCSMGMCAVIKN